MPINFIPNDPLALSSMPMRQQAPQPNRPANRAGFTFIGAVGEGLFNPGSPEFLFWQCREAALMAMATWEVLDGNLSQWARVTPNRSSLALLQDDGVDLNAFYDGQSLSFFHFQTGAKTTFSGASTDVVAHETGHSLLDAIRPDLWDTNFLEVGAFHEAFGDCMALLTALSDRATREALLAASPDLGAANFLEATAEDLSDGVKRARGANHPAAQPRHALNTFRWQLPTTLPPSGPPQVLSSEVHSLGRVFSGCFYDTLRNIFASSAHQTEATLLTAAQTAGKLLIAGARNAPEVARFFRAVGRAMTLADEASNNGAHRVAIRNAFAQHNLALGSAAMLAPTASLAGPAPKLEAAAMRSILPRSTRHDLLRRIGGAPGDKVTVERLEIAGERMAKVVHHREVPLDDLDPRLEGVVASVAQPVLVGASGTRAAVLGALPEANTTTDEVLAFVTTLLKNDAIALGGARRAAVTSRQVSPLPTHTVRTRGRKKVLTRIRFVCHHEG
jgi:hypothetical protein